MNNSINLYFHLEIKDIDQVISLVKQSLNKIEQLEDAGIPIGYLQLRAKELLDSHADKEIWLKIDSNKGTYIGSDAAFEWDKAFITTVTNVEKRMLYDEADYTRNATLVELTTPSTEYFST